MGPYLNIAEILISVILILVLVLQLKGSGAGFVSGSVSPFQTRRGLEKTLFQITIVLAVLFIVISVLSVRLARL
ncbi:MAG: preprotein translocase subunit SecG [Chloroflexota bacterium]